VTILGPRCLLESIKKLVETTYLVQMSRVNKPDRLTAVDDLRERTMKKNIFDVVELMNCLSHETTSERTVQTIVGLTTERLIVVDPRPLGKALTNATSLVALQ
jgi:hypothetical protein